MFDPKKFTTPTAKPLPVVLLLDVSSSMSGDKIENLNKAVEDMLDTFAQEEKMETEILVSVITFGNEVELHVPYTKASQVKWQGLQANGMTPMGTALKMAKAMIEDKETTPSRAYRPTIVLVSDGQPNDSWERSLEDFISQGRSSKCDRMAMAIGRDADENVLKRFIEGTPHDLFYAENAGQLHEFFQRVTMSVTMRTQSKNPNVVPTPAEIKLDGDSVKVNTTGNITASSDDEGYW
ncbi:vWA domain-containing protein [Acinetobacter bereziniae]|uniref:vWA domain-containing protein n=1 Tax=Acinetobacter bereziniae TaxID=106648 RepID=UPI002576BBA5|nr:VWA domain-containing protein [Acinetobacter bereziniae]MDM1782893.1 VWA domain-containing protein [Acinetobacter bereziniae]